MKKIGLLVTLSCLLSPIYGQNLYEDALTAASYAYSHSKNAYGANNVFHTQEYADKAVDAFAKVEILANDCGCKKANETAFQAKTDMESSLEQDTYERSRYYAKRAKDLGSELLKQLTLCQANVKNGVASDIASAESTTKIAEAVEEVTAKQKELEEKRRQLELQQKQLEQQIAAQEEVQKELEEKRALELQKQATIKTKAEQALKKLENAIQELSIALNEDSSFDYADDYLRSESELQNESLDDTKNFYVNRAKELTKTAMQQFASYSDND